MDPSYERENMMDMTCLTQEDDLLFPFHRLEHHWERENLHRYRIEPMRHLLLASNFLQYLEWISVEPEKQNWPRIMHVTCLTSLLFSTILIFNLSLIITITCRYDWILSRIKETNKSKSRLKQHKQTSEVKTSNRQCSLAIFDSKTEYTLINRYLQWRNKTWHVQSNLSSFFDRIKLFNC
jgi:hypothetical protein